MFPLGNGGETIAAHISSEVGCVGDNDGHVEKSNDWLISCSDKGKKGANYESLSAMEGGRHGEFGGNVLNGVGQFCNENC